MGLRAMLAGALLIAMVIAAACWAGEPRREVREYRVTCYGTYLRITVDPFAVLTGNAGVLRFYSPYFPAHSGNLVILSEPAPPEPFVRELARRWAVAAEAFIQKREDQGFLENWGAPAWEELLPARGGPCVTMPVPDSREEAAHCRQWRAELVAFKPAPLGGWLNRVGASICGRACYTLRVYPTDYTATR
ncbi:hypothetical protein [Thermodesulfitimonas autotrophica]|uniref:hypothetical protein n=1 Tax=Thermodesulfitimonas autotrophica TaxID=1894989 RepID=UPI002FE1EAFA